ncbi:hypothetical protein TUBRATIS_29590 [Tubulinosema ratisbonensis]|uniref:Uncharacterized protein n=1 Tax=Tubulinosema ratisbonensis TaxID=291195 RepID=A0A437AHF3_9MICR|nr:hypothetical protein TUBRATIS_29590 [Tubulinosema ratisbonensis]
MAAVNSTQSRTFQSPLSNLDVEVVTYKNPDGGFRNAESMLPLLKRSYLEINDFLLTLLTPDSDKAYVIRTFSASKAALISFKIHPNSTKLDFETEEVTHYLTGEELDRLKETVVSTVTEFLELFSFYHHSKNEITARGTDVVDSSLVTLLRFSAGAKIRYLEELLSLYLTFNGQTYFDVTSHVILSGSFTFGALFSTTGLYYAAHQRLSGKEMLHDAQKRTFVDSLNSKEKGEIHTPWTDDFVSKTISIETKESDKAT